MKKILSIDWDYFMDCNKEERVYLFPDGGREYSPKLMDIIWASYYKDTGKDFIKKNTKDIKIDDGYFSYLNVWSEMKDLSETIFASSISHLSIISLVNEFDIENIELINIDYHHDCYNHMKEEKNCGNWLIYLLNNFNIKAKWIKRKDSDLKGLPDKLEVKKDLSIIKNFNPDYIFLTKSNIWSPPHLDNKFLELLYNLSSNTKNHLTYSNSEELTDRYNNIKNLSKDYLDNFKMEMINKKVRLNRE